MRSRALFGLSLLVVLALWAGAETPAEPVPLATPVLDQALADIRPQALRAHMTFLADDLLEGRGTGTRGHMLAAKYMAAQFAALGLEPAGVDGGFFQPVPLRQITVDEQECSLSLLRAGREKKLVYGENYLMGGFAGRTESSVSAPVVFVGYGVTAPELGYDDYADVDVRGKIVLYMARGTPASFPSDQRAYYSSSSVKRENAAAHGAVGVLTFLSPEAEKRMGWERIRGFASGPAMTWVAPDGTPADEQETVRGRALVNNATVEEMFAGAPRSLEQALAELRGGKFRAFGLPVEARLRVVSRHTNLESPNVVGLLPGSDPDLRDEYVVYTAHLDHLGMGEAEGGDAIYNGALDNASGNAVMVEVARAFARLPERPRRSLLFVAVTAEEKGLLGADYFAQHPTVPRANLVANINLDSALMLHPLKDVVAFGAEHSSLSRVVEQAAARLGLAVSPDPMPEEVFFIRSDQYPFVRRGIPAVFLLDGFETGDPNLDGGKLARDWLHTFYHSPKDDLNQAINFEAGSQFARVNFLIGYLVANQTGRPTWNAGDFFGEKFGARAADEQ